MLRKLLLAVALCCAPMMAWAATLITVTSTTWVQIAAAGATVEVQNLSTAGIRLSVSGSAPASTFDGEVLVGSDNLRKFDGPLPNPLWAIALNGPGATIAVNSIGAGGGGGGGSSTLPPNASQETGGNLAAINAKLPILASGRMPVDGSGVTQPISAAALPLPAGAATAANQTTGNTSLAAIQTAVTGATPAGANTIGAVTQSGTWTFGLSGPIPAGTNTIGKVGIDQTTPGTTNRVSLGTDIVKSSIDQTTPGTTNKVSIGSDGAVSAAPSPGTFTNRSGTITTGGTSQTLAAINSARKAVLVQNPCAATENLYINFTSAAAVGAGIELLPCGSYTSSGNFVSTELVTVFAATTGHAFVAKEGQ